MCVCVCVCVCVRVCVCVCVCVCVSRWIAEVMATPMVCTEWRWPPVLLQDPGRLEHARHVDSPGTVYHGAGQNRIWEQAAPGWLAVHRRQGMLLCDLRQREDALLVHQQQGRMQVSTYHFNTSCLSSLLPPPPPPVWVYLRVLHNFYVSSLQFVVYRTGHSHRAFCL